MDFTTENNQDNSVLTLDNPVSSEMSTSGYGLDAVENEFSKELQLDSIQNGNLNLEPINSSQLEQNDSQQLVFIDPGVEDSQTLIDNISGSAEVVVLDDQSDPLLQISQSLDEYQGLDAVHIVSHGDSGQLSFKNADLNQDTLPEYRELIEGWGDSLDAEADLLLYGCDVASGEHGNSFLQKLSQFTEADILASTNDTGIDGDWELETKIGEVEADSVFDDDIDDFYQHNLFDFDEDLEDIDDDDIEDTIDELDDEDLPGGDVDEDDVEDNIEDGLFIPETATVLFEYLNREGEDITLELFGGEQGQFSNAFNVDIIAERGIQANILDDGLSFVPDNSVNEIFAINPFIPRNAGGSDINDYLPEAARTLKSGSEITILGTQGNKFTQVRRADNLEELGLEVVENQANLSGRFENLQFARTDGSEIPRNRIKVTTLKKQ